MVKDAETAPRNATKKFFLTRSTQHAIFIIFKIWLEISNYMDYIKKNKFLINN